MCSKLIVGHIMRLSPTTIFTTRDMLPYGNRGAVDQTLCRLVAKAFIVRLANGVFVRDISENPPIEVIARAKLEAWGKKIFTHADDMLSELELVVEADDPEPEIEHKFAIDSHSSNFQTIVGRVTLHGIGPRKVALCEENSTSFVYALWCLGKGVTDEMIGKISRTLNRVERDAFRRSSSKMPRWLQDMCQRWFPEPKITV